MIHPKEMPYAMGVPYRDREPIVYDGGDFPGAMEKVGTAGHWRATCLPRSPA
jgi:hypothetical protein